MPDPFNPNDAKSEGDVRQFAEAAALRYDPLTEGAPRLIAHGRGTTADKILELAKEMNIPVRQDPTLLQILGAIDVGSEIPPDLYGVIAEVLAWAYHTDKAAGTDKVSTTLRKSA